MAAMVAVVAVGSPRLRSRGKMRLAGSKHATTTRLAIQQHHHTERKDKATHLLEREAAVAVAAMVAVVAVGAP